MEFRNSKSRYGAVSKLLHWSIATLVFVQVYLVYWKNWMLPEKSPLASFYINGLHKPIGAVVLILVIFAILWKINNPKPSFPFNMPNWQKQSSIFVHNVLYATLLIMPLSGLIMSTAAGYPPNFFGLFQFPQFILKNESVAQFFFDIHAITGFVIIALIVIHIGAALKHHFIDHDDVLKRMLP